MPRPSAWTKNVLSGTKKFCLGQKKFCPGQKYFVRDKIFWSPVKSSFLFMRIQFRSCSKFFVRDKNFLSWTKIFCPGQIFFCPRQNFFVPDKTFFVHAEGRGIYHLISMMLNEPLINMNPPWSSGLDTCLSCRSPGFKPWQGHF